MQSNRGNVNLEAPQNEIYGYKNIIHKRHILLGNDLDKVNINSVATSNSTLDPSQNVVLTCPLT